jgi:hypothetical protein
VLGLEQCNLLINEHLGGGWACSAIATAAMAVHAGLCKNVLVFRAMNGRSERPALALPTARGVPGLRLMAFRLAGATGHRRRTGVRGTPSSPQPRLRRARVPYVIVHVALDGTDGRVVPISNLAPDGIDGRIVLVSNLKGCDWQSVRVGMPVTVVFDADGLPRFRPV